MTTNPSCGDPPARRFLAACVGLLALSSALEASSPTPRNRGQC